MISIIVPVYNGSKYIRDFYNSCLRQTYRNFEIVFIDDGSTDDTLEKLKRLKDESLIKIRVLHQENKGVSSARNRGIEISTGDLLCFCDIDDEILSSYLEEMYNVYNKYNADLVISRMRFIKEKDIIQLDISDKNYNVRLLSQTKALEEYLFGRFKAGVCTILVSRSKLIDNKIKFPEGFKYNEDIYTMWHILANSCNIALIDEQLYFYKQHRGSAMDRFDLDRLDGYKLMKSLENYFSKNNPVFYKKYKRFGSSRIAWSLSWQSALFMDYEKYIDFITTNNFRKEVRKLFFYPNIKVALSSIVLSISPKLFRFIININKPYRYK